MGLYNQNDQGKIKCLVKDSPHILIVFSKDSGMPIADIRARFFQQVLEGISIYPDNLQCFLPDKIL